MEDEGVNVSRLEPGIDCTVRIQSSYAMGFSSSCWVAKESYCLYCTHMIHLYSICRLYLSAPYIHVRLCDEAVPLCSGCDRCCERDDHSNPCCFSPVFQETPNSVFLVMEVGGVTLSECNFFCWAACKLPGSLSLCWYLSPLSSCSLSLHVHMVISSVLWEAAERGSQYEAKQSFYLIKHYLCAVYLINDCPHTELNRIDSLEYNCGPLSNHFIPNFTAINVGTPIIVKYIVTLEFCGYGGPLRMCYWNPAQCLCCLQ